ncbi:hypothetical protein BOTBODRAFT_177857 [Botryobasidium botryosum FD-172 SS1]|uniref:Uncharacterized protein n=1 Tax=Botryobasidium botryosum (strain FD-172 SS1) TaxID=930990 RepID=A0A067MFX5_BOTB1|nr:hypothetical protein BOTBODRAFT_177857 [Botryobasidium botryosum FD-172 SS1]
MTHERKTADRLLHHMREILDSIQKEWGVKIVAFTLTRRASPGKLTGSLRTNAPGLWYLIVMPISLIVGDYFKANPMFKHAAEQATTLINWLRSRTFMLSLLRSAQLDLYNRTMAIIRAIITRWTAHYLAFARLLETRYALNRIVSDDVAWDKSQLVSGKAAVKEHASEAIAIISSPSFWFNIARCQSHASPKGSGKGPSGNGES